MEALRYGQVALSAMNWPTYVATDLDLWSAAGLGFERRVFPDPPAAVRALCDGEVDLVHVVPEAVLDAAAEGADLRILGSVLTRCLYRLIVSPSLRGASQDTLDGAGPGVAGLRGRRFGVNEGRYADALLLPLLLRHLGLRPDEYRVVVSGPPRQRLAALRSGAIDGVLVSQPFDIELLKEGFVEFADVSRAFPAYPFVVSAVRRDWAEAHPRLIDAYRTVMRQALELLDGEASRGSAVQALSRQAQIPAAVAEATWDLYRSQPGGSPLALEPGDLERVRDLLPPESPARRLPVERLLA